jgi:hypothetical protein
MSSGIEIAADRGPEIDGHPDGAGVGHVTVAEITKDLRRDALTAEREGAAHFGKKRGCRRWLLRFLRGRGNR